MEGATGTQDFKVQRGESATMPFYEGCARLSQNFIDM